MTILTTLLCKINSFLTARLALCRATHVCHNYGQVSTRFTSFDCSSPVDVRGTFWDISKVLDKAWHDDLILKLQRYDMDGKLLKLLKNYLKDWHEWVVLNGQTFSWKIILKDVPQGSLFGSLFFSICINDLQKGGTSVCKIFANDTSLFSIMTNRTYSETELNLKLISQSAYQ